MAIYTSYVPTISEQEITQLYELVNESIYRHSGAGSNTSLYATALTGFDRFGYRPLLINHETAGLTFITRPKLNLTSYSLNMDPKLATLNTLNPMLMPFAIRCMLDTKFSRSAAIAPLAQQCHLFNEKSPFMVPLTNFLSSISGFPDKTLDTYSTEGGFFSEDQSYVMGDDQHARTYELTLTFREIQGGFLMALFFYWIHYMGLVARGTTIAYPEDIAARRLNYTVSIYRFVLDPSQRYITKWAKATGCFPKTVPIGNVFNIGEHESYLSASTQFPITFVCNHIDYMNPLIFRDFNTLMRRYAGDDFTANRIKADPYAATSNFVGLPYIDNYRSDALNELCFYATPEEMQITAETELAPLRQRLEQAVQSYLSQSPTVLPIAPGRSL